MKLCHIGCVLSLSQDKNMRSAYRFQEAQFWLGLFRTAIRDLTAHSHQLSSFAGKCLQMPTTKAMPSMQLEQTVRPGIPAPSAIQSLPQMRSSPSCPANTAFTTHASSRGWKYKTHAPSVGQNFQGASPQLRPALGASRPRQSTSP